MIGFLKNYSFCFVVLFIAALYYLLFVNLGLDFGDEGHVLYAAKRIVLGETIYKDFYWIYTPGQAIVLSFLFKIFSSEVIVGRYYTLFLHLGIVAVQAGLLLKFGIKRHTSFIIILCSMVFGLPLMNVPYVVLPAVLLSLLLVYVLLYYLEKRTLYSIFALAILSTGILFFKQNAGVYYYGLTSLILLFLKYQNLKSRFVINFIFHSVFWIFVFAWVYPLFLESNIEGLREFITFSFFFRDAFLFSYPPLNLLLKPLGVFKLLPYYLPILSVLYLLYLYSFTNFNRKAVLPLVFALVGFGGNMYPGTDLLHLYPFYSSVVLGISIILYLKRHVKSLYLLLILNILIGVYLTFFKGHLRYEAPYVQQTVPLKVDYGRHIYTYQSKALGTQELVAFMKSHTTNDDKILVYPFSPMVYFLLDNPNISKDSVFYPPTGTMIQEDLTKVLNEERYYIITIGNYINNTNYSHFISEQEKVFESEFYRVYRVD